MGRSPDKNVRGREGGPIFELNLNHLCLSDESLFCNGFHLLEDNFSHSLSL